MVYIVDDDAVAKEALSTLLRANGKQVQIFTSGRDFLDFECQNSCACLILDLRIPERQYWSFSLLAAATFHPRSQR
jgi:FixJ family two-component response regulator